MIIAKSPHGPVEASRDLHPAAFTCPLCGHSVIHKPGRVNVPHFAHEPGADCTAAGESARHLLAKRILADEFRSIGYTVTLEESHRDAGRRIDVAVTTADGDRVAVEVQDSPISIDDMKRRNATDRRLGFLGTAWIFTGRRYDLLAAPRPGAEVRIPEEMRWFNSRYNAGVFALDGPGRQPYRFTFGSVYREGSSSEWYEPGGELASADYPGRTLTSTKTVNSERAAFRLTCYPSRWHKPNSPDWGIGFAKA